MRPKQEITIRPDGSIRCVSILSPESPVQLQFADEVDINNIINKFQKGIPISHLNSNRGSFTEGSPMESKINMTFEQMLNTQVHAARAFEKLSPAIRNRFGTAEALLNFLEDPSNLQEAIKLGLVDSGLATPKRDDDSNDNANKAKSKTKKTITTTQPPQPDPQTDGPE